MLARHRLRATPQHFSAGSHNKKIPTPLMPSLHTMKACQLKVQQVLERASGIASASVDFKAGTATVLVAKDWAFNLQVRFFLLFPFLLTSMGFARCIDKGRAAGGAGHRATRRPAVLSDNRA